jgi:hypothetical protein
VVAAGEVAVCPGFAVLVLEAALWSAAEPLPTVVGEVWLVTGAVAELWPGDGLAVCPAVWSEALFGVVPAACPALALFAELVASVDGLLV